MDSPEHRSTNVLDFVAVEFELCHEREGKSSGRKNISDGSCLNWGDDTSSDCASTVTDGKGESSEVEGREDASRVQLVVAVGDKQTHSVRIEDSLVFNRAVTSPRNNDK